MVRLKGFQKLVPVDEALRIFFNSLQLRPEKCRISTNLALGRILAQDIKATTDLPRTNRSAVDGYAVKADETANATQSKPRILELTESNKVGRGQTKQIWTGNSIPENLNSAVMLENTKCAGNKVKIWEPVTPWENISRKGEDIRQGELAVRTGTRLRPQQLGLAAALGVVELEVYEKPKVAVIATGNELTELGSKLKLNEVFDINKIMIRSLCAELGAETLDLGIARDNLKDISGKLLRGVRDADAVVTSGGTSVGSPDLVPETINQIGKPGILVHGVAMRPGMPTALAVVKTKPVILLPGNPVAAMLSFEVFGRPLISRMLGLRHTEPRPFLKAKMTRGISTTLGRKTLVRVCVFEKRDETFAEPISARGSSLVSTLTKANGYVIAPENVEGLREGDVVTVSMFDDLEVPVQDV